MDAGLSMATIQKEVVTHAELTALFWINVALGAALMVLTVGLAPVLSAIYHEPRLTWIAFALAVAFPFWRLGRSTQGDTPATDALQAIGAHRHSDSDERHYGCACDGLRRHRVLGPDRSYPRDKSWERRVRVVVLSLAARETCSSREYKEPMLQFGGYLTAGSFINSVREQLPYVVIGYSLGAAAVATYERAYRLLLLPVVQMMPPMSAVALPALSRLQNDPAKFRRAIRQLITLVSALTVPCSVICVLTAPEIIPGDTSATSGTARPPFLRYCLHSQRLRLSRRSGSGCWWRPVTAEHCSVSP